MSEMVERVAQAIAAASLDAEELPISAKLLEVAYKPLARAAIEAMREPTDGMVWSGEEIIIKTVYDHYRTGILCNPTPAHQSWDAMIDAALKEA